MKPLDELAFWKRAALIFAVACVMALVGGRDADDAEITALIVEEKKELAVPAPQFPIAYDATVTQMDRDGVWRTRLYTRPENR